MVLAAMLTVQGEHASHPADVGGHCFHHDNATTDGTCTPERFPSAVRMSGRIHVAESKLSQQHKQARRSRIRLDSRSRTL